VLWAALLEKALAKSFGSYKELGKSSPLLILQRLTGGLPEVFRWAPVIDFAGAAVPASEEREEGTALQERLKSNARLFARGSIGKEAYLTRRNELFDQHGAHARIVLVHRRQKDALFQRISQCLDAGAVIGASCRASRDHEDTGQVSRDHMFSVVSAKSVRGVGFLGVRSRWGKGSWNAFNALLHLSHQEGFREVRWGERHKALHLEASLALRRFLGVEMSVAIMRSCWHVIATALHFQKWKVLRQQDSLAFWVSIDQFVTVFNSLYMLSEINRDHSLSSLKGQWMCKGVPCWGRAGARMQAAGSVRLCTAGGGWPQSDTKFQLTVLVNRTRVRIVLHVTKMSAAAASQPAVTFEKKNDKQKRLPASMVTVGLVRELVLLDKGPNLDLSDFILLSRPCDARVKGSVAMREVELSREESPFVLIPMALQDKVEGTFRLDVYSTEQCFLRGKEYSEQLARPRQRLPSARPAILPDMDSDWEDSHQQDDAAPQEEAAFDAAAWGSLVQTNRLQLHPRLASVLYREDVEDLAPGFRGKVFSWHAGESLPGGDARGGIVGWEGGAPDGTTKARVQGLLLRNGLLGLQRLAAVEPELMGMLEVRREGDEFSISEHRVCINCADLELGTRSLAARLAAFGKADALSTVGDICFCDPPYADSKLRNARDLRGKVACIPVGGTSSMQEKVLRAFHAGSVAVIIINDTDELYAIAGDGSCALDKASNVMATLESRDAANDVYKISLLGAAQTFAVSRKSLVLTDDVTIPVIMVGHKDGQALKGVNRAQISPSSADSAQQLLQQQQGEGAHASAKRADATARVEWAKATTPAERDAERKRVAAQDEQRRRAAKAQQESAARAAADHSNSVGIVSESVQLLQVKADLRLEAADPLQVSRIALHLVGISAPQFKDSLERIFVSLQFYHYEDLRDVPVALEPVRV